MDKEHKMNLIAKIIQDVSNNSISAKTIEMAKKARDIYPADYAKKDFVKMVAGMTAPVSEIDAEYVRQEMLEESYEVARDTAQEGKDGRGIL
jgi:hypothetical protein